MIIRNLFGAAAYPAQTLSFRLLPLGIANIIILSAPFAVVGLAKYLFNDPILAGEIKVMMLSFVGLLFITFAKPVSETIEQVQPASQYILGVGFSLLTLICLANVLVMGRKMKGIHFSVLQLHFSFWGAIGTGIFLPLEQGPLFSFDRQTWLLILCMGGTNVYAMNSFAYTSQHAKPTTVALLRYMGVLYSFAADLIFWHQQFAFLQIVGVTIMLTANILFVLHKIRMERNLLVAAETEEQVEMLNK